MGINISISRQVLSFLSFTTKSGLFAFISLSVWVCMSQSIVTVWFSVTLPGPCSQCLSCSLMLWCLQIVQWRYAAALLCLCMYSGLASSGHPETRWLTVS